MYIINTNKHLKEIIEQCLELLLKNNIPISKNIYFKEGHSIMRYGSCVQLKSNIENLCYQIIISKYLIKDSEIQNTIVHELLHTIPECLSTHNEKWKHYAKICSKLINSEITVSGNKAIDKEIIKQRQTIFDIAEYNPETMNIATCPRCNHQICIKNNIKGYSKGSSKYICKKCNKPYYYKLPFSIFRSIDDTERHKLLEIILKENYIKNICLSDKDFCYLSQEDCDYMWLFLRSSYPQYFINREVEMFQSLEKFISKKAIHKLAVKILNGQFDYLKMNYDEWINFSTIFCLTRDYLDCENYYWKNIIVD